MASASESSSPQYLSRFATPHRYHDGAQKGSWGLDIDSSGILSSKLHNPAATALEYRLHYLSFLGVLSGFIWLYFTLS
jgi:hypothetical protein